MCCPSLPRTRKRSCVESGHCLESGPGHSWGCARGVPEVGGWLSPEWPWLSPEWPWTNPFCPCRVLGVWGSLVGGPNSLGTRSSLPHLFLEMKVFLHKFPQVWETLIRMRQTSCFFALPQAALSLALKEPGPLFCYPAVRLSPCWRSLWGGGRGDLDKLGLQAAQDFPSSWAWESSRGPEAVLPGFKQPSLCMRHFIAGP